MMPSETSEAARPVLTSGLVSLVIESLLFGAFTILYGACAWILLVSHRPGGSRTRNGLLFVASTVMYALTLVHVALDIHIALECFVRTSGDSAHMSDLLDSINGLGNTLGAAKFAIYVTQTLIGDGFMIYRAYVVWDRLVRIAIVPLALLLAQVVIGYYISFSGSSLMNTTAGASCADSLSQAFFLLSVATNIMSTGLIVRRILWTNFEAHGCYPNDLPVRSVKWRVFESILQSAAIYSITSLSLAMTVFLSPTIAFPAFHSVFPSVIGIVFVLIVVRICLNTSPPDLPRHSMMQINAPSCPSLPIAVQDVEPRSPCSIRSVPITIHVSVSTTSDRESEMSIGQESSSIKKMLDELDTCAEDQPMSPMARSLVGRGMV
ncbi:hypothetical protein L226DRAFT_554003 [Lentinus tigrinus ALCF2SS1-7]|uniref:Uncharacterized protein n=1 Tax=Lentinus tigrinus ALCF2SS1-6 TaxID=1328759 RepID=A0A5C2S4Q6_9APHY|nr:hypothetical protein L227DRAFT_528608 [Lentinus tigrinus ALCF2SS1-6]RPD72805.1 hypothetical protein L226DRAFT_554003 [Lentinus tigrinus ALCF2SS1-7]